MDIILNTVAHSFLSEAVVSIFSKAPAVRSIKDIEIHLEAATYTKKMLAVHFLSDAVVH